MQSNISQRSDPSALFKPEGNQIVVTWSMAGKNNVIDKVVGLFLNMDKMVGGQFEQGLAAMKSIVETATK